MSNRRTHRPVITAGTFLGVGLGGFIDGILFHQILQWHGMLTHRLPKSGVSPETALIHMQVNMFWDGLFHAFTWLMTAAGIVLLWRAGQRTDVYWSTRVFVGSLPMGWGLFNLCEGIVDHHVLHLHHVFEAAGVSAWDYGFLVSGAVMLAGGWLLVRSGIRQVHVSLPDEWVSGRHALATR